LELFGIVVPLKEKDTKKRRGKRITHHNPERLHEASIVSGGCLMATLRQEFIDSSFLAGTQQFF